MISPTPQRHHIKSRCFLDLGNKQSLQLRLRTYIRIGILTHELSVAHHWQTKNPGKMKKLAEFEIRSSATRRASKIAITDSEALGKLEEEVLPRKEGYVRARMQAIFERA